MAGAERALFKDSPVAIILAGPSTQVILTSNAAAHQLYGYSEEELVGLPLHKLCNASFAGKSRKHIRKDGAEIVVDAIAHVVALEDGEAEFLFIIDRTEAQQTEQRLWQELNKAQAALRVKNELLAMMSQEIRTPLAGVTGMAALLAETNLNEQQRDFLSTLRSSSDLLTTVVNEAGDLRKMEEQTLDLEAGDFDLRNTIEDVFEITRLLASQKKLELKHELSAEVPAKLKGDAARLKQILLTLLANLIGIVDAGSVKLAVTVDSGPSANSGEMPIRLKFELAENGAGTSSERARLLFRSFGHADSLSNGNFDWPAVGLAICRRLANLMEGEIGLSGAPGPGTIFSFRCGFSLPADERAAENAQDLSGREVLLVQRSSEERSRTRGLLQALGMIVTEAGNAPQALALASARGSKKQAFPLVLVDWCLPVIDGISFARLLRAQATNQHVNVVLLANTSVPQQLEDARQAGVLDVLVKPLRQRQLAKCISQVTLPAAPAAAPAALQVDTPPVAACEKVMASILVVEDNLVNQMVASLCLQKLGYAVQIAEDGFAAVDAFSSKRFDLILMDCHMPRMDGATATKKIRDMGGYGSRIPILALTADVFQTERDRCMAAGMNDFLSKPIRAELLKSKLEFWLEQST
jgi:CheY-like chemotaxis protein/signal transduction histidine kinase